MKELQRIFQREQVVRTARLSPLSEKYGNDDFYFVKNFQIVSTMVKCDYLKGVWLGKGVYNIAHDNDRYVLPSPV